MYEQMSDVMIDLREHVVGVKRAADEKPAPEVRLTLPELEKFVQAIVEKTLDIQSETRAKLAQTPGPAKPEPAQPVPLGYPPFEQAVRAIVEKVLDERLAVVRRAQSEAIENLNRIARPYRLVEEELFPWERALRRDETFIEWAARPVEEVK